MKKIISVLICAVMLLSVIPFTVAAANEAKFTLRIKEETDKALVLVLDFDGGTGFSALDFEVEYDRVRLQIKGCKKGEGYEAFEDGLSDPVSPIYSSNANENPIMFSMANISPFKVTDGKKSVAQIEFTKVPGTKFEKDDVKIEFTNCQTAKFNNIEVAFDYDLTPPAQVQSQSASANNGAQDPQQEGSSNSASQGEEDESSIADNSEQNVLANDEPTNKDAVNTQLKKAISIAAVILIVVGIGVAVLVIMKKKKGE